MLENLVGAKFPQPQPAVVAARAFHLQMDDDDDRLHDDPSADYQGYYAVDDVSGDPLERSLVAKTRKEGLEYFKSMQVYDYAPLAECIERTKKGPIGTRWIDTNKGDAGRPNYRSRLVGRGYNTCRGDAM